MGKLEHLSIAEYVLQVVKISYLLRFIAYALNTCDSVQSRMHAAMKKHSEVWQREGKLSRGCLTGFNANL